MKYKPIITVRMKMEWTFALVWLAAFVFVIGSAYNIYRLHKAMNTLTQLEMQEWVLENCDFDSDMNGAFCHEDLLYDAR